MRLCRCCGNILEDEKFVVEYNYADGKKRYSEYCSDCIMNNKGKDEDNIKKNKEKMEDYIYYKKMIENLRTSGKAYINKRKFSLEEIEKDLGKKVNVRDSDYGGYIIYVDK